MCNTVEKDAPIKHLEFCLIAKLYETGSISIKSRNTSYQEYLMNLANMASNQSSCSRHKVGALLSAMDKTIISTGFNGTDSGVNHCSDIANALESAGFDDTWRISGGHREWSNTNENHAEFNMFRFANALFDIPDENIKNADYAVNKQFEKYQQNVFNIFNHNSIDITEYFSSVYVTHMPCLKCTDLIIKYSKTYNITKVYFNKIWYNDINDISAAAKRFNLAGIDLIHLMQ